MFQIIRERGEPLTLEEYIGSHGGFLPGERERLERLRFESLQSSASPERAPAPPLAAAVTEAAPDHAAAGNRCEELRSSLPSPAPTFADAPAPPPKTEPDRWRARSYEWAGEDAWMAR